LDAQPALVVGFIAKENDVGVEVDQEQIEVAVVVEVRGRYADAIGLVPHAPSLADLFPGGASRPRPERIAAFARGPLVAALRIDADVNLHEAVVIEVFENGVMAQGLRS